MEPFIPYIISWLAVGLILSSLAAIRLSRYDTTYSFQSIEFLIGFIVGVLLWPWMFWTILKDALPLETDDE